MPPHPLRRISTGSLSSLARSTDRSVDSPSDLAFLERPLNDLADEAATLASNVQRLNTLHDALGTFNEGFAAYLYAVKMNAFSMGWPEAPLDVTWSRLPELTAIEAPAPTTDHTLASSSPVPDGETRASSPSRTAKTGAGDMTYMTVYSDSEDVEATPGARRRGAGMAGGLRPPAVGVGTKVSGRTGADARTGIKKPAPSAAAKRAQVAAKKKRQFDISTIIEAQLPLEYRGGDADARLCMEKVIDRLWDGDALGISDMVKPPEMPHPKVNKCLIALVAKKLVSKSNAKGKTLYTWAGAV